MNQNESHSGDKVIAAIPKSKHETLRINLSFFNNRPRLDIRMYVVKAEEEVPTKKGISLPEDMWSGFFEAIQDAHNLLTATDLRNDKAE